MYGNVSMFIQLRCLTSFWHRESRMSAVARRRFHTFRSCNFATLCSNTWRRTCSTARNVAEYVSTCWLEVGHSFDMTAISRSRASTPLKSDKLLGKQKKKALHTTPFHAGAPQLLLKIVPNILYELKFKDILS